MKNIESFIEHCKNETSRFLGEIDTSEIDIEEEFYKISSIKKSNLSYEDEVDRLIKIYKESLDESEHFGSQIPDKLIYPLVSKEEAHSIFVYLINTWVKD